MSAAFLNSSSVEGAAESEPSILDTWNLCTRNRLDLSSAFIASKVIHDAVSAASCAWGPGRLIGWWLGGLGNASRRGCYVRDYVPRVRQATTSNTL
jgi:hypothetical protein